MAKKYVKSKCVKLNLVAIFNECKQIRAWNSLDIRKQNKWKKDVNFVNKMKCKQTAGIS